MTGTRSSAHSICPMKNELKRFSEKLAFLSDIMKKAGIDDDIIEARYYSIANLRTQLKE